MLTVRTPIADAVEVLEACTVTVADDANIAVLTSVVASCIQVAESPLNADEAAFRLVMRLQARNLNRSTAHDLLFAAANSVAGMYEGSASHKRVIQRLSQLESDVAARLERPLSIAS